MQQTGALEGLRAAAGDWWPYLVIILAGFLPTEIWRWSAVFLSRGFSDQDEAIVWVRAVSTALLTGVVAKLLLAPSGALVAVPLLVRFGALALGMLGFWFRGRSVMTAIVLGESLLLSLGWSFGNF